MNTTTWVILGIFGVSAVILLNRKSNAGGDGAQLHLPFSSGINIDGKWVQVAFVGIAVLVAYLAGIFDLIKDLLSEVGSEHVTPEWTLVLIGAGVALFGILILWAIRSRISSVTVQRDKDGKITGSTVTISDVAAHKLRRVALSLFLVAVSITGIYFLLPIINADWSNFKLPEDVEAIDDGWKLMKTYLFPVMMLVCGFLFFGAVVVGVIQNLYQGGQWSKRLVGFLTFFTFITIVGGVGYMSLYSLIPKGEMGRDLVHKKNAERALCFLADEGCPTRDLDLLGELRKEVKELERMMAGAVTPSPTPDATRAAGLNYFNEEIGTIPLGKDKTGWIEVGKTYHFKVGGSVTRCARIPEGSGVIQFLGDTNDTFPNLSFLALETKEITIANVKEDDSFLGWIC